MATDQQVALTRAQRVPAQSSHISKAARQVVPAFLQKLYEMVNDPNNAELIRWSDAGDSFFVLDHERFAHEVLGRWFKHRNFNSFVRQLNMYGFHKIPHLQQGVLKSDTDTEFWNFAHPNFHRGQPDLLCLIQRKKQAGQPGGDNSIDLRDSNPGIAMVGGTTFALPGPPPASNASLSNNQVLDIQSIMSGINAIKRHQTTISSELNELKRSNQLLWQDAMAARAKHQKQQDTINRIVKFLAGVFGSHNGTGSPGVAGSPSNGQHGKSDGADKSGPRRARLMIEDAKRDGPTKSIIEELNEMPMDLDPATYDYPTIETPKSVPSPSPSVEGSAYFNLDSKSQTPATELPPKQPQPRQATTQGLPLLQDQGKELSRAVTPSISPNMLEFDSRISGMLNQLSPGQIQQLLASLAAQTLVDPTTAPAGTINPNATSAVAPYQPPTFDFLQHNPTPGFNPTPLHNTDQLIPFDEYNPSLSQPIDHSVAIPTNQEHEEQMDRQWKVTEDIDKDVSALNTSIHSLIQTFGLDPTSFETLEHAANDPDNPTLPTVMPGNPPNIPPSMDDGGAPQGSDFDFDSFFNNLSTTSGPETGLGNLDASNLAGGDHMKYTGSLNGAGAGTSAFLDEVQTPTASSDMTASPALPLRQVSPEVNLGTGGGTRGRSASLAEPGGASTLGAPTATKGSGGRKRKSEVVDVDHGVMSTESPTRAAAGTKSKRRKDK